MFEDLATHYTHKRTLKIGAMVVVDGIVIANEGVTLWFILYWLEFIAMGSGVVGVHRKWSKKG